jgi:hypothetical protein
VSHPEVGVFQASNAERLLEQLKWATIEGTRSAASPKGLQQAMDLIMVDTWYGPPPAELEAKKTPPEAPEGPSPW